MFSSTASAPVVAPHQQYYHNGNAPSPYAGSFQQTYHQGQQRHTQQIKHSSPLSQSAMLSRQNYHQQHPSNMSVDQYNNLAIMSPQTYHPQAAAMAATALPPSKQRKPTEIFVGDLSFFCTETHLFELFSQYGNVQSVRIVRSQKKTRSLNFGFVCLESVHQSQEVCKILNGHLFMGRKISVEMSDYKSSPTASANPGFQVHVSFWGTFMPPATTPPVLPTEVFLRKFFIKYGTILDAAVREYTINPSGKHFGYGFVAFEQEHSATTVLQEFANQELLVQGIVVKCTPSFRTTSNGAHVHASQPTNESVLAWMEKSSLSFDGYSPRSVTATGSSQVRPNMIANTRPVPASLLNSASSSMSFDPNDSMQTSSKSSEDGVWPSTKGFTFQDPPSFKMSPTYISSSAKTNSSVSSSGNTSIASSSVISSHSSSDLSMSSSAFQLFDQQPTNSMLSSFFDHQSNNVSSTSLDVSLELEPLSMSLAGGVNTNAVL